MLLFSDTESSLRLSPVTEISPILSDEIFEETEDVTKEGSCHRRLI